MQRIPTHQPRAFRVTCCWGGEPNYSSESLGSLFTVLPFNVLYSSAVGGRAVGLLLVMVCMMKPEKQ